MICSAGVELESGPGNVKVKVSSHDGLRLSFFTLVVCLGKKGDCVCVCVCVSVRV